jgi:hypothetical protein
VHPDRKDDERSGPHALDHPDFYLKSRAEMMRLFGELEDAVDRPGKSPSVAM